MDELTSDSKKIHSPGKSPLDPQNEAIDPVAFALDRLHTHLIWVEEHRAEFDDARETNQENAQQELVYMASAINDARQHLIRLTELLLAGYAIDPKKRLPKDLIRRFKLPNDLT